MVLLPTYRIFINGEPTEDYVTETSYIEAYFTATKTVPQQYKNDFRLEAVELPED